MTCARDDVGEVSRVARALALGGALVLVLAAVLALAVAVSRIEPEPTPEGCTPAGDGWLLCPGNVNPNEEVSAS